MGLKVQWQRESLCVGGKTLVLKASSALQTYAPNSHLQTGLPFFRTCQGSKARYMVLIPPSSPPSPTVLNGFHMKDNRVFQTPNPFLLYFAKTHNQAAKSTGTELVPWPPHECNKMWSSLHEKWYLYDGSQTMSPERWDGGKDRERYQTFCIFVLISHKRHFDCLLNRNWQSLTH